MLNTTVPAAMYSDDFYSQMHESSKHSVEVVLDQLQRYIPPPNSVVDVGAGVGSWLKGSMARGCKRVIAIEGEWVQSVGVQIPRECYQIHNLEKPLQMNEIFDLAISLEVAEHLSEHRGPSFVDDLTHLADIVLFSAAVPGQGGTRHLNEQWQQVWVEQFKERGFECFDIIRPHIWNDDRIRVEYRQNMLVFVRQSVATSLGLPRSQPLIASVLHPQLAVNWGPGIKIACQFLWKAIVHRVRKSIAGIK